MQAFIGRGKHKLTENTSSRWV